MKEIVTDDVSMRALIRAVTDELIESQAERVAAGGPAVFEVGDLTLEISFVATTSKHAGGGFNLTVVKADAGAQYEKQSIHKVTLTLKAVQDQLQPFGAVGPVRPRLVATDENPEQV